MIIFPILRKDRMAFCNRKKAAACRNQIEQVLMARSVESRNVDRGHAKSEEIVRALTESMAVWLALTGPARMA
jgi:hypothetical protein